MPTLDLPPDLVPVVDQFTKDNKRFLTSAQGRTALKGVTTFSGAVARGLAIGRAPQLATLPAGDDLLRWVDRMPSEIVKNRKALMADFDSLGDDEGHRTAARGIGVLVLSAMALLRGLATPAKSLPDKVLSVAFGADPVSEILRNGLGKGFPPALPEPFEIPDNRKLEKFILGGTVRDLLRRFATCGAAASLEAAWVGSVAPMGSIRRLSKSRACEGDRLSIDYDLGAVPPAAGSDILLSLPRRSGCTHLSLRTLRPDLFQPSGWQGVGSLDVVLPAGIYTGALGFFGSPPPLETSMCPPGGLVEGASALQSIMGDVFGSAGVLAGQSIVEAAARVEAGRHRSLPCATPQADGANFLNAGVPVIDDFRVVEHGPVYPRGYATLRWSVANADLVEIVAQTAPNSLGVHELPTIAGPLPFTDQRRISIAATRRWEGQYVLRATNANGCTTVPVESTVALRSGFSSYRFGVAKVDITDARPNLPMLGFSDEAQTSSGEIDLPQYARAFVVEENSERSDASRIAMVVCDIWGCSQLLKNAVITALNSRSGRPGYTEASLIIGCTHTHAGPGGFFEYYLYNMTGGGFDQRLFDLLVNGIVSAIGQAESRITPGSIYINTGQVADCGANRSLEAYMRNADAVPADPTQWTDRSMTLLKFVADLDDFGATRALGSINWFALHPTSLGMFNKRISGDSKGWAAELLERDRQQDDPGFVAAFANAAAGDVSGNLSLDQNGAKTVTMPLGSTGAAYDADHARMMVLANRQFEAARDLCAQATEVISGPLKVQHANVDMSNVSIAGSPGARTWPAAMGVSFGAGSSEDSLARVKISDGLMVNSHIMEGYTTASRVLGAAEAVLLIIPLGLTIVGAALGSIPVVIVSPGATLTTIVGSAAIVTATPQEQADLLDAALSILPPHGCAFVTSTLATFMLPGRLVAPQETNGDRWQWDMPCPCDWPADFVQGHGAKPIMLAPGLASLVRTATSGATTKLECPLVPHVLPMHLISLGQLAIVGVPAEFTSSAGKRMKADLLAQSGNAAAHAVIFGYANSYSGYVTTPEEYDAQHYEGASTLYGPHTLAAYIQIFAGLADAMRNNAQAPGRLPFVPPAITRRAV